MSPTNNDMPVFASERFVAALSAARPEGTSWREVARAVQVSPSTLTRLRQGTTPDLDTFLKLCSWAQLEPQEFLHDEESTDPHPNSLAAISAVLRSDPSLDAAEVDVLEGMIKSTYELLRRQNG